MTPTVPWFALIVKPRYEKAVVQGLRYKNIEEFLPMSFTWRRWSDRMKLLELPLFPGYVFCRCDYENRLAVLDTPGVASFVSLGRGPAEVSNEEIGRIRAIAASGLPAESGPFVRIGQRVRIEDGPLAGLEGILDRNKASLRVVVNVELLQRSVLVEVDRAIISALPA